MKNKYSIYAWPAFATKRINPYNYLIYNNVKKLGYPIYEFHFKLKILIKLVFSTEYRIIHFHWPRHYLLTSKNLLKAWKRTFIFALFINLVKFSGKKLVWTVHNLETHESRFPFLEKLITRILYKKVDGFISLNEMGLGKIRENIKSKSQKVEYIGHPHFKNYYANNLTKSEARAKLGIPSQKFVFLFLGVIRPYKNVPALIDAFHRLPSENKLLLIAGMVNDADFSRKISEDHSNIILHDSFVKNDDLQIFFNAADVVVTPYKKVFNSGSAFLNLSFNKPTLAPNIGVFAELKAYFGTAWIKTYEGEISGEILEKAMQDVIEDNNQLYEAPDIKEFDPEVIGAKTVAFYESL